MHTMYAESPFLCEGPCSPTSYFNAFSADDKQTYEKRSASEVSVLSARRTE